ncbi:MAG: hypothetical protein OXR64_11350 [Chloroflexota bacterium]|nr:hypothetical protein [Chloroflexota bacterium]MDE2920421.1 hypothetical protein [Chloroflexota bacterium]
MIQRIGDIAYVSQGIAVSGRGAGARPGDWEVRLAESADISDDRLEFDGLKTISIQHNARTERHLLRPYDVLVTGRSRTLKMALVPPAVSRTVASVTLLVVRPRFPESGMSHWLWYFLTSSIGRSAVQRQIRPGMMIPTLPASSLAEVAVPVPPDTELHRLAEFTEASESAYQASLRAARLRRELLRDSLIEEIAGKLRAE